jgi:hypothetical protein
MQARIVDTRRGARWLAEGWRLFRAAPLGWLAVVFLYMASTQVVALLPLVGAPVALLLVPAFSVGLMAVARAVSRGAPLEVGMLFDGFRHALRPQLVLGAVYVACVLAVFGAMRLADQDGVLSGMSTGTRKVEDMQADDLLAPFAAFALAYTPVMMLFWFAPPLAAWHDTPPAKALFFSFFACLLNWRAFLAYGAVTALVMLALPLAALMLLSAGGMRPAVISLVFPLVLVLLPTLFASFYASYQDVFGTQ